MSGYAVLWSPEMLITYALCAVVGFVVGGILGKRY